MMADPNLKIVEKSTFEQNERFGFAAVIENSEEKYELITSIGGMKLTTISKESDIASNIGKNDDDCKVNSERTERRNMDGKFNFH